MFGLPVTIYEIIKFSLSKWSQIEYMDLQEVGQCHELQLCEYVIGWCFNGLHDGETMAD